MLQCCPLPFGLQAPEAVSTAVHAKAEDHWWASQCQAIVDTPHVVCNKDARMLKPVQMCHPASPFEVVQVKVLGPIQVPSGRDLQPSQQCTQACSFVAQLGLE